MDLFERRPEPQALSLALQGFDESFENRALDIHALRTQANLSRIQEHSLADPIHRFLKIAVGENDRRILAAQFKRHRLHRRRHCLHDRGAGLRLAGKGNRIHVGMLRQKFARRVRPEPVNDVVDAVWNSRLLHRLGEKCRGRRSFLGRFHHHSIAAGQRGSNFPRQQQQRQVPRSDDAHHAQGLADRIIKRALAVGSFRLKRFQTRRLDQVSEHAKIRSRARNIQPGSQRDWLAGIRNFGRDETIEPRLDRIRDLVQPGSAFANSQPAPLSSQGPAG